MKLQTGIWLDKDEAFLIDIQGNLETSIRHIYCPETPMVYLEDLAGDYNDPTQRKTGTITTIANDCSKNQLFYKIMEATQNTEEIFLFGLQGPLNKMADFINKHRLLQSKILKIETCSDISLTSKVSRVEFFFNKIPYPLA
jgi:hypothetical protein